jgi:zinc protease
MTFSVAARVERHRLGNGLRVVLAPDPGRPVVGVAVHYAAGFRAEPPPHEGLAHLVEHLMFTGSAHVGPTEHAARILAAGGSLNATTRPDHSVYFQVVPAGAVELALFLEADRMRSLRLTEDDLAAQVAVVKDEIALSVTNQPYGGFPWLLLPPVMFEDFAHRHNGYGEPDRLDAITPADVEGFVERHHSPGNAVLTVAGGAPAPMLREMVERHFGGIPGGHAPVKAGSAGVPVAADRRELALDLFAAEPALALGWRAPDPAADPAAYLAWVLVADVLASGPTSRLHDRLLRRERLATSVSGYLGAFGEPFAAADPVPLQLEVYHPARVPAERVTAAIEEEIGALADAGPGPDELVRVRRKAAAALLRSHDQVLERTLALGALELHRGDAALTDALPDLLLDVPAERVRAAARAMARAPRAVLELRPKEER